MGGDTIAPAACWEKVLWKKQAYEDNYVDASFLSQLRTNATASFPTWEFIMLSSLSIGQKLSIVLLFVAIFAHLYMGLLHSSALIWLSTLTTFILACMGSCVPKESELVNEGKSIAHTISSIVVLIFALQALSPVVRTFSETTTDGSVWACAAILFGGHLAFADYSMLQDPRSRLRSTISLNMAMCASVVLSSRLTMDADVYALLLVALQLFAIYPLLRDRVYTYYGNVTTCDQRQIPRMVVPITSLFVCASMYAMWRVSPVVAVFLEPCALFFVCLLCPLWMRRAQRWKTEMRGPWDEAVLVPPPLQRVDSACGVRLG